MALPQSPEAQRLRALANKLLAQNQQSEAIKVLEELLRLEPGAQEVHSALGRLYLAAGNFNAAITCLQIAVAPPFPRQIVDVTALAVALASFHCVVDAIPLFEEIYKAGVREPLILTLYGQSLEILKRFKEARAVYREVARLNPDNHSARRNAALCLVKDGLPKEAAAHAEKAAALKPDDAQSQSLFAIAKRAMGDVNGACAIFQRLAGIKFDSFEAHANWIECLAELHGPGGLVAELERIVSEDPCNRPALYQLALHCYRNGQLDEAKEFLSRCETDFPPSGLLREFRARLSLAYGKIDQAVGYFEGIWDDAAKMYVQHRPASSPSVEAPTRTRRVAPVVYMPVEIKGRELASRVLTACIASELGLSSVISWYRAVNMAVDILPPGIFFHKTINGIDKDRIRDMLPCGHVQVAIDEEALGWTGASWAMVCDADPEAASLVDRIFLPGARHDAAYKDIFPRVGERVRVTGNPRFDLLTPVFNNAISAEVEKLRQDHRPFVLVCTNFGTVNSSNFDYREGCDIFYRVTSPTLRQEWCSSILNLGKSTAASECSYIAGLQQLLPEIARKRPDLRFILRAHPGEDDAIWHRLAEKHTNIRAIRGGSLQAWLQASDAVVYMAGCTTGLEAYLAGVRAFRFQLDPSPEFPKYGISAHINQAFGNAEELAALLTATGTDTASLRREEDEKFIAEHIRIDAELSARRIAKELRAQYDENRTSDELTHTFLEEAIVSALQKGKESADREARLHRVNELKRVSISVKEVEEMISQFQRAFGLSAKLTLKQINPASVFIVPN